MKKRLSQLLGLSFICFILTGCYTIVHVNHPDDKAEDNIKSIDNVFVLVYSASIPDPFIDAFVPDLQAELQNKGIRASVRQNSGLELNPVTEDDLKGYSNLMTIRATSIQDESFTMTVKVIDIETNQEIMNANVSVSGEMMMGLFDRLKERSAENTARKLAQKMQELGILQVKD